MLRTNITITAETNITRNELKNNSIVKSSAINMPLFFEFRNINLHSSHSGVEQLT